MAYLFVHFRETYGTEGEQVYFSVSKDGYVWEIVNDGKAVLIADKGDLGVRDITITKLWPLIWHCAGMKRQSIVDISAMPLRKEANVLRCGGPMI